MLEFIYESLISQALTLFFSDIFDWPFALANKVYNVLQSAGRKYQKGTL